MIASLPFRVAQLLFAAVVLGLSATLIKQYGPATDKPPALFDYGAFCGGAGLVIALFGIVACFVESLQGIILLALDGLASFFLLAGGIAYAATIKTGSCSNGDYLWAHYKTFFPGNMKLGFESGDDIMKGISDIEGRCKMTQASTAFLWFTFACAVAAVVSSHLSRKSGRGGSIV